MAAPALCLKLQFRRGEYVDVVVNGVEYTGSFVGSDGGLLAVLDPFEVSFVAANAISVSSSAETRKRRQTHTMECRDPVPAFKQLLRSLLGCPVLLQVESIFVQGIVVHVGAKSDFVQILVKSQCAHVVSKILVGHLAAVLVPLAQAPNVVFGDPQYQLAVQNRSAASTDIVVFQQAPPGIR